MEQVVPVAEILLALGIDFIGGRNVELEFAVGIGDSVVRARGLEDLDHLPRRSAENLAGHSGNLALV
ncbi:MAG: hypothetical protein J6N46_08870 [Bacteroidales bacterium]|nr:hypothetical protein [Bacteroidales bacterium]